MAAPVSGFFCNTANSGCISRTSPSQIGQIAGSTMPNGPRAQAGSISSSAAAVRLAAPAMAKARVARSSCFSQPASASTRPPQITAASVLTAMLSQEWRSQCCGPMVAKKPAIELAASHQPYEARSPALSRSTT